MLRQNGNTLMTEIELYKNCRVYNDIYKPVNKAPL